MNEVRKRELLQECEAYLVDEAVAHRTWVPEGFTQLPNRSDATTEELWLAFRFLVNVRPPWPAAQQFLVDQDELLQGMIEESRIHTLADAEPSVRNGRMRLWRGDITTLAVDAIVNAANSAMTGCWQPLHYCIDNTIHTFAGVQLRAKMTEIMAAQGHEEPTGEAKMTSAYNLPAKHVIHTVGPIADGHPTDLHRQQLAQCYRACLDRALEAGCVSIAFCCISTGVFGFPQHEAAMIAVTTVRDWLDIHGESALIVVFNVFGEEDERIYRELLM